MITLLSILLQTLGNGKINIPRDFPVPNGQPKWPFDHPKFPKK